VLHVHSEIRYGGGPAGYLHELTHALKELQRDGASLPVATRAVPFEVEPSEPSGLLSRIAGKLKKTQVFGWRRPSDALANAYWLMNFDIRRARAWAAGVDLPRDRAIVVHDLFLAEALASRDPQWAREKLCLMTHAPHFYVRQTIGDLLEDSDEMEGGGRFVERFVGWEQEVMNSVRTTIWPCAEAMEAHRAEIGGADLARRVELCLTGVAAPEVTRDPAELRASWGVREGQKVVLFLGRPHPHKGFHVFEKLAEMSRAAGRDDLVFLWGGRGRRSQAPSAARHLGFVTENAAAMLAADLNIVPNTVTYMDIGVLQALSLGAPLLLSCRGGNRTVRERIPQLPGFEPVADEAAVAAIDDALDRFARDPDLKRRMIAGWRANFSPGVFARNHLDLARRLEAA
jgi:glycosyltransferase involved in cell wall biosynthesis